MKFAVKRTGKPMESAADHSGFTLTEAVVAAVIIAFLSAIGIPLYRGYVDSARQDTVDTMAQTAAAAAHAYYRKTGASLSSELESNQIIDMLDLFVTDPSRFQFAVEESEDSIVVTDNLYSKISSVPYK
jgi:prepilin-type N-terminal cleavage/methylation domain-containing protein